MIDIQEKQDCVGCNACGDICAHHAISFKNDEEGFWYPLVDKEKCTDCGLCEKVCPVINIGKLKKNDYVEPKCFAAIHKNYEVRFDSTSGGLFSAFAEKMYKDGGYVGGALYDENGNVKQYISPDKTDLPKLRSSKYSQSNFEGFFSKVRDLLKQGEKVLVCGGPCQMAALRAFLGYKDYENLLILDYVCRGINSPLVSRKYRESLEAEHQSKIVYSKAKNKEFGWRNLTGKTIFANGDIVYKTAENNRFTHGYLITGAFCRPSCYDCKFKGFPRIADISLADFWGIEKIKGVDQSLDDDIGTSLVLINSEKGERFFEAIKPKLKFVELPYKTALDGNKALVESLPKPKIDREKFFEDVNAMTFDKLADKYFPDPRNYQHTLKGRLKNIYRVFRRAMFEPSLWAIKPKVQFFKYNFFRKNIQTSIPNLAYFRPSTYSVIDISKSAKVVLKAPFSIGNKHIKGSRLETRLMIQDGAHVEIGSRFGIMSGGDVEIFKNATFKVAEADFTTQGGSNINLTLICGNRIEIGYHVMMGRNVTIRDNNGGHYLSVQGYKESQPVKIGNHVWLCEGCTIMPGAKIGDGAIIGAGSVVYGKIPPNCLASGNPARVIQTETYWKY